MKFILKTTGWRYRQGHKKKELEKLGFTFSKAKHSLAKSGDLLIDGEPTITIDSLEELMKFVRKWGRIVLSKGTIEIYDNYRE